MQAKTQQLVSEIVKRDFITEKEIKLIFRRMNSGIKVDLSNIWNECVKLTEEQDLKGITFLNNLWKTPKGVERKNNPFGYREQAVLESFKYFEFAGTYDAGNRYHSFYVPLYNCNGTEGSFQYYYAGGQINIIG